MIAYYNEWEPYPAQWLRNLIAANLIARGDVDERSIKDVKADDLTGYTQCHFFAGIGGWSYALRLAGWPDERPVWTGSCPCQPFSVAGKQNGHEDERHLWPVWFGLIRQLKPSTIFGEQVSASIAHGWLDDVYQGLEGEDYAVGSAILPACSVGAPHKRDRLWFVAHPISERGRCGNSERKDAENAWEPPISEKLTNVANTEISRREQGGQNTGWTRQKFRAPEERGGFTNSGPLLADTTSRCQQRSSAQCNVGGLEETLLRKGWHPHNWDVESALGRVANGVSARSHKLRAYGNAIVPQVAQAFITAFMECRP